MPRPFRLDASPENVHWGYFDARLKPQLTIASGDRVTISTVSGGRDAMPPQSMGLKVPPALAARVGISKQEAYMLCSLAADVRITQVVNGAKGVHVMLDKTCLAPRKQ